jgi:hypothetical protein
MLAFQQRLSTMKRSKMFSQRRASLQNVEQPFAMTDEANAFNE